MKVVLTGGGTGGHFYPLIAVAEKINSIVDKENIADVDLFYFANKPYNEKLLYENDISFKYVSASQLSFGFGIFKIIAGFFQSLYLIFSIYPDVIFSKGGYAAFPTVAAARVLGIPLIIHESDSVPGKVNFWSAKFAKRIAVSYRQEIDYFNKDLLIHTGQPIVTDLEETAKSGAHEYLNLRKDLPVIWVIGGSTGAQKINNVIDESLLNLLPKYQIIHQTGVNNIDKIKHITEVTLSNSEFKTNYHPFGYLDKLSMKMTAGVADLVITRAGSILFEIANWGIPAIIIPITESNGNHQIRNAYNYSRDGGGIVIEENNLSDSQLLFEINRIMSSKKTRDAMIKGAERFSVPNAAQKIAEEIVGIGLKHEK